MRRSGARRALALSAALLAATALWGCDTPAADSVITSIDFYNAVERGEGASACTFLTQAERATLSSAYHKPCRGAVLAAAPTRAFLRGLKVGTLAVTGDHAIVSVVPFAGNSAAPLEVDAVLVQGSWLLTNPFIGMSPARRRGARS
jgi:hypothetical protein